jgi:hypothetical protein
VLRKYLAVSNLSVGDGDRSLRNSVSGLEVIGGVLGVKGSTPPECLATAFHCRSYCIDYLRRIDRTRKTSEAATAIGIEVNNLCGVPKDGDIRIMTGNYRLSAT